MWEECGRLHNFFSPTLRKSWVHPCRQPKTHWCFNECDSVYNLAFLIYFEMCFQQTVTYFKLDHSIAPQTFSAISVCQCSAAQCVFHGLVQFRPLSACSSGCLSSGPSVCVPAAGSVPAAQCVFQRLSQLRPLSVCSSGWFSSGRSVRVPAAVSAPAPQCVFQRLVQLRLAQCVFQRLVQFRSISACSTGWLSSVRVPAAGSIPVHQRRHRQLA